MKKSIFGNLPYNNSSNCPKLKWSCYFESGITQGSWVKVLANSYSRTLSGVQDVVPFFGAGAVANIVAAPNVDTDTEIDTVMQATSMGANGGLRRGARELYITFNNVIDHAANSRPQGGMQIKRSGTAATPDIDEIFFRSRITLPSNFSTAMDPAKDDFFTLYDEKTGLYSGTATTGDYRLVVNILNIDPGVYTIRTRGDNVANGHGIIPSVGDSNSGAGGYWYHDLDVPLVDGREYILEVYRKKPVKIFTRNPDPSAITSGMTGAPYLQDTTTGITKAWLTDVVSGIRYTLCSQVGGQQNGNENLPCARHFVAWLYSGGGDGLPDPGMSVKITGIEFWDTMPQFMGWSESVAVDASLAGGTTQPREGTDTLSIDFTSSTPTQVTISRNDNSSFAVWPNGNLSEYFTEVTGGLEFDLSLAHMNLGVNTIGVKASYSDYRKATDSISLTIEAVVEVDPEEISVAMAGGLTQYQTGIDTLQITFESGTPTQVNIARNAETTFAQWPTGNLYQYFREVPGGLEFDLGLAYLNLGENSIGVTATYSDASTAEAFLSLNILAVEEAPPPTTPSPIPAFPGAEGFGAASVGGRGGSILFVTNLNDSGAGSLREALLTTGPRTVIFRVGGTIDLLSDISLSGANLSYLTVAGQTAPGGIQTRYKTIEMSNGIHDVIIRFLRHRRGWEDYTPGETESNNHGPGLTIFSYGDPCYNIIIDHSSFAWQQDDNSFWQSVHDVTWQWCILAEAKNTLVDGDPVPLKGVNGKGLLSGTEDGDGALMYNVSLHHNFIAHNYQRSPLVKGAGPFEIVNNLVYNWAAFGTSIDYTNAEGSKVNLIGNYYKEGPDAFDRYAVTINDATHPADMIYVLDNISPQRTSGAQDEWDVIGLCDGSPYCNTPASTSYQKATPWAASDYPITIDAAADVPAVVLAGVGATLPARDATDTRIVSEYYLGTGSIHTYNSWPTLAAGTAVTDADNDGMADSWETAEGVSNPNAVAANGYTNLENYINSLV